jgi:hypothetical protein
MLSRIATARVSIWEYDFPGIAEKDNVRSKNAVKIIFLNIFLLFIDGITIVKVIYKLKEYYTEYWLSEF